MRHVLLFLFYRWQSWGTKMFLHSSACYRWPDNKSSPTNPWSSVLSSFLQMDLLGQKKCADDACHKSFIVRRVGHTSSVLAPGLPKAKANQLHLLLHLQFLPFPSFSPLISQTCSSLRLHSLSPFSLHSLIPKWPPCIRQGGLGFAAVTIKYSMFCSNKSCFSFMLDVHQGHLWLCSL